MVTLLHFTQTQGVVQLTKSMEWGTQSTHESSEWVAYNHKLLVTRSENKELFNMNSICKYLYENWYETPQNIFLDIYKTVGGIHSDTLTRNLEIYILII